VFEGNKPAVYLCPCALVADIGMDIICQIHRSGLYRKDLYLALRSKDKDILREEIDLERLKELVRVGNVSLPLDELPEPGKALIML